MKKRVMDVVAQSYSDCTSAMGAEDAFGRHVKILFSSEFKSWKTHLKLKSFECIHLICETQ